MLSTALTLADGTGPTTVLSVPGLGALRAGCANGVTTTQWQNTTSGSVTVVNQIVLHKTAAPAAGDTDVNVASVAAGATVDQPTNTGLTGQESLMWQASDDSTAGDRVTTLVGDRRRQRHGCRHHGARARHQPTP